MLVICKNTVNARIKRTYKVRRWCNDTMVITLIIFFISIWAHFLWLKSLKFWWVLYWKEDFNTSLCVCSWHIRIIYEFSLVFNIGVVKTNPRLSCSNHTHLWQEFLGVVFLVRVTMRCFYPRARTSGGQQISHFISHDTCHHLGVHQSLDQSRQAYLCPPQMLDAV